MNGPASINRLRWCATIVVALVFAAAGCKKLITADAGVTMVGRYLPTPSGVRALGCMEVAMALWLLSGRNPKLAPATAAAILIGLSLLIGAELQRNAPLPCGCLPTFPGEDPFAARRELWVGVARNGFLIVLCVLTAALVPQEMSLDPTPTVTTGTKLSRPPDRR